jgi:hypothetical protein
MTIFAGSSFVLKPPRLLRVIPHDANGFYPTQYVPQELIDPCDLFGSEIVVELAKLLRVRPVLNA